MKNNILHDKFCWGYNNINQEQKEKVIKLFTKFQEVFKNNNVIQELLNEATHSFYKEDGTQNFGYIGIALLNNNCPNPPKFGVAWNAKNRIIKLNIEDNPLGIISKFIFELCNARGKVANVKFENYKEDINGKRFALDKEKAEYENFEVLDKILPFIKEHIDEFDEILLNPTSFDIDILSKPPFHYDNFEHYLEFNKTHTQNYENKWEIMHNKLTGLDDPCITQ